MITEAMIEAAAREMYELRRPSRLPRWEDLPVDSPNSGRNLWLELSGAALEAAERAAPSPIAQSGNITDEELAELIQRPGYVQFIRDDGWQPIETALRDGTRIMLFIPVLDPPTIQAQWRACHEGGWDYGEWVDVRDNDVIALGEGDIAKPTHWRPLPEPPNGVQK